MNILVTGWTLCLHSYSLVNIFQILALSKNPLVEIYLQEYPPHKEDWNETNENNSTLLSFILEPLEIEKLKSLPKWDGVQKMDVEYRITYPYDMSSPSSNINDSNDCRLFLFYTAHSQNLAFLDYHKGDWTTFVKKCHDGKIIAVTPSNWSAMAMRLNNYDPLVIPYGIDPVKLYPFAGGNEENDQKKVSLFKDSLSIPKNAFVFLNVGAITQNKNVGSIIKAIYRMSQTRDDVYLILKGIDCEKSLSALIKEMLKKKIMNKGIWRSVKDKVIFIDDFYSHEQMLLLYNTADCYVSPYIASGFNLPVLESLACGTPVIVPKGGSTDDFTTNEFAKYPATIKARTENWQQYLVVDDSSLQEKMLEMMNNKSFRMKAKEKARAHVLKSYTWDIIAEKMYNIFKYVADGTKQSMINNCHSDPLSIP